MHSRLTFPALLSALLTLTACNGLFGGIYDEFDDAAEKSSFGFIERDADGLGGTIFVDASSYTRWVFLDLHNRRADTVNTADSLTALNPPFNWDLALHRYDVKTHGGAACATSLQEVAQAASSDSWHHLPFSGDSDSAIVVDMSTMMDGYLGYCPSPLNPVLSRWLDVDTREMPPVYTLSNKVYVLRMADGTCAALQFTNYLDEASRKGFATIRYRYPLP